MIFNLPYGEKDLIINLPDHVSISEIGSKVMPGLPDPTKLLRQSLCHPIDILALKYFVKPGYQVGIVFNDSTRYTPNSLIINAIINEIPFITPDNITLFEALGSHRQNSLEELQSLLGEDISNNYKIVQNDAYNQATHKYLGVSTRGNEIWLNKQLLECDVKVLIGVIEPHFFAGYSGGGKSIIPGMAGIKTIHANHSFSMINDPASTWGITQGNPVWEDITDIEKFVPGCFLVNVTLNKRREITGIFCGEPQSAHRAGCDFCDRSTRVAVQEPPDIVITTNSGYPLDRNLYQTVKGISAAAQIIRPHGSIIIASECRDGIPNSSDFAKLLQEDKLPSDILDSIARDPKVQQDQWQVQILLAIKQKANVYLYCNALTDEQIRSVKLIPCRNIESTVSSLLEKYGPNCKTLVLTEGPQTIPYLVQ
jgi:nickel-dependent lactate racemase